jgi:hypothetical protein
MGFKWGLRKSRPSHTSESTSSYPHAPRHNTNQYNPNTNTSSSYPHARPPQ